MALGGGTFTVQNKVLPGAYINFVSLASAEAKLSDRGYAAMGIIADWGDGDAVVTVTSEDFQENSKRIFGYSYTSDKLKGLRDLFANINVLYAYRLNGKGMKATNTYATAKYAGTRGNDISIIIRANADDDTYFDVSTALDAEIIETQTVKTAAELVANDFVTFNDKAQLEANAGVPLEGGTNSDVDGESHQTFLNKIENYSFNALGCVSTTSTVNSLYVNFTKRMRDQVGKKFQLVAYNTPADYEGVVNVKNSVSDGNSEAELVYWVTGVIAGTAVNKSALNKRYDGEFTVNADYTQSQLEQSIAAGEFVLHRVGEDIRVLMDVNSLMTFTNTKGEIFQDNQTIRVIDQIANDTAVLFNTKYLGAIPNDKSGRVSLWSDIVQRHMQLQSIGAIENFADTDVSVEQGIDKKSVVIGDALTIVNAMTKLYMTVTVA